MSEVTSEVDTRFPQPGREAEYGIPLALIEAGAVLRRHRANAASSAEMAVLESALFRLYDPYIKKDPLTSTEATVPLPKIRDGNGGGRSIVIRITQH